MNFKPLSVFFLSLAGLLLILMDIYFIFLRPPLLPEDIRYIGSSLANTNEGLSKWLQKVFWVIGFFIFTTGLLTVYLAQTSFPLRAAGSFTIVLIACFTSIGAMTIVNMILQSDFRWVLFSFTFPWFLALALYRFHK